MSEEKSKEKSKVKADMIQVSIQGSDGDLVAFRVRKTTKFSKVIKAYCKQKNMTYNDQTGANGHSFASPDGNRIAMNQTLDDCGIENEDVIDCFAQQTGG